MHYSAYTPAMCVHCVMPAIITAGKNDTKQQSILTLTDPLQSIVSLCDQIVFKSEMFYLITNMTRVIHI